MPWTASRGLIGGFLIFASSAWADALAPATGSASTAAAATSASAPSAEPAKELDRSNLRRLWDSDRAFSFEPYRESYVLFTHTNVPDSAPYSPNPADRVPASYDLLQGEAKFQFSLKALLVPSKTLLFGERDSLWFAYTQQSYWQIFDAAHSRPFRESNYEPELIYSRRLGRLKPSGLGWQPAFVNFGFVHQSNGQSDPRSRSWNRVYAQLALVDPVSDDSSFALLVRPWWRFREAAETDNNPDVTHYLGFADVEALYWKGPYLVSLLTRIKSLQADVSMPLTLVGGPNSDRTVQLHLQVFTGYGESLIDYNQKHTTIGIGVSVPYGLQ